MAGNFKIYIYNNEKLNQNVDQTAEYRVLFRYAYCMVDSRKYNIFNE